MRKVFAVDDDADMLELVSNMLFPMGCSMATSTRCKGAVDQMRQYDPDVILLDVMLPDGSGYEISRSVRADTTLYKTPILFISAIADPPEVEYALSQGCDAYLHKPFSLGELNARFHDLATLTTRINQLSAETGLMTLEAITREIDHRVFQQRTFSLCYISIDNFDAFQVHHGTEEASALIVRVGVLIRETQQNLGLRNAAIAHLGREHFLTLLPLATYRDFCRQLESAFHRMVPQGVSLRIDISLRNETHQETTHSLLRELQSAHQKREGGQQTTLFRWNLHRDW